MELGQRIEVKVLNIDLAHGKIGLEMIRVL